MAINLDDLISDLRTIAPRELDEDWDNGGFQINMGNKVVNKILISLEITNDVIEEASELGVDFIVTHHPLIFKRLDVIDATTITGNYIIKLINKGITVYSSHTSFDSVFGGNNDYLAELLGLQKVRRLKLWTPHGSKEQIGRMGILKKSLTLGQVTDLVKDKLNLNETFRIVGHPNKNIRTVAVCTGAGGDSLEAVVKSKCDLYITGEISHHEAQMAKEIGLSIIVVGHYASEFIFIKNFADKLRKQTEEQVEILESKIIVNPFEYVL
jgi:dinuclear metal center YbgI/SA1388 family protein